MIVEKDSSTDASGDKAADVDQRINEIFDSLEAKLLLLKEGDQDLVNSPEFVAYRDSLAAEKHSGKATSDDSRAKDPSDGATVTEQGDHDRQLLHDVANRLSEAIRVLRANLDDSERKT